LAQRADAILGPEGGIEMAITPNEKRTRARPVILMGLFEVIAVAGLCIGLQLLFTATKSSCFQEGPFAPEAAVSERLDSVAESVVAWPLGRACAWERRDGAGVIITYSATVLSSMLAYGFVLGGVGGVAACGARKGGKS
jgi:hypothetical protein